MVGSFPNTYYFAMSAGMCLKNKTKSREMLCEPLKIIDCTLGFNIDANRNVKFTNQCTKMQKRTYTLLSSTYMSFQWALRSTSFISSFFNSICIVIWPSVCGHDFDIEHLDNRQNGHMNDLISIDFAKRDWLEDHDQVLARTS